MKRALYATLVGALFVIAASVTWAQTYSIPWQVIDSGGGQHSSSSYILQDSVGQPAIGVSTSTNYTLEAGFLYGLMLPSQVFTTVSYLGTGPLVKFGWNLVSIPGIPDDPDPLKVFANINVQNSSFQFWKSNVDGGDYQSYGSFYGWTGPIEMGVPYWFLHQGNPTDLSFNGQSVVGTQSYTFKSVKPAIHWVMFGPMQNKQIAADNVTFTSTSNPTPISWSQAYTKGLAESKAFGFSNATSTFFTVGTPSTYPEKSYLEPWFGYWLLLRTDEPLTIYFP